MHEQAYHTSCRRGLAGQPGFQFNAASPGLSASQLSALAARHAGYQAPRDLPPQPTHDELKLFPVSLKHVSVEGVGRSVSRTAYVGREFRGIGGEADAGRFGNYFSHIVAGGPSEEPFDDLLPIELWDADHWSETEAADVHLEPLPGLSPGPLDLETVIATLSSDRVAWIPAVVDAIFQAAGGGPRLVLVEEAGGYAAAWIALASFALPRATASTISFSTFEGRPRTASFHICCTTPGCDVAFEQHEIGRTVALLDVVRQRADPERATLLGRVVGALAAAGSEPLATASRAIVGAATGDRDALALGARLAVFGECPESARDEAERAAVIEVVADETAANRPSERLASVLRTITEPDRVVGDRELGAWLAVHAAARSCADPSAADVADAALDVLVPLSERIGSGSSAGGLVVQPSSATRPAVRQLAAWLESLSAPSEVQRLAPRVAGGWRLGLVGVNSQLDHDVADCIAGAIGREDVQRMVEELAADPESSSVVASVAACLADQALDRPTAMQQLASLARHSVVFDAVNDHAEAVNTFAAWLAAVRLRLSRDVQPRRALAGHLVRLASERSEHAAIMRLFDISGPRPGHELAELITCYVEQEQSVPDDLLARGWRTLGETSLANQPGVADAGELARVLSSADRGGRARGEYVAWYLASHLPSGGRPTASEWVNWLGSAVDRPADELPDERFRDLLGLAAQVVFGCKDRQEHLRAFESVFALASEEAWAAACSAYLTGLLDKSRDPAGVAAAIFSAWERPGAADLKAVGTMFNRVLPSVLDNWPSRRREAVRDALPENQRDSWDSWNETFRPSSGLGRTFGRLVGRKERS